jgi:CRISPR/Cas system-associated exonuclease Cas4 (RecB family)
LHPTTAQYTFFSAAHGTFSKIDHIWGHKESLNKYRKLELIPCILSDHNAIKLELNKKKHQVNAIKWRLNNTLLNDQWVIEEIRKEIKKFWKWKLNLLEPMGQTKAVLKGKFIAMSAINKWPNAAFQTPWKTRKVYLKPNRRREIINIRAQVNETVTRKTIQRSNNTKRCFFEKNKLDWQTPDKFD